MLNTIIGIVLALAALLAYLIQRARYLKETEPDLELIWPENIRLSQMQHTLKNFWSLYIDLEVVNQSKNHADDLQWEAELDIFPQRGGSTCLRAKYIDTLRLHQKELLAGRRIMIPVYVGWNLYRGLYEQLQSWPGSLEVENAGFEASITLKYFTKRELLMWTLMPPWNCGRKQYKRKIKGSWGFIIDRNIEPPYIPKPWQFPEESLRT